MNVGKIKAIVAKDIKEVTESLQMLVPIIVVPLIILVIIPLVLILLPRFIEIPSNMHQIIDNMIKNMPIIMKNKIINFDQQQLLIYMMINYFFGPLFLIIPLMVSSIIAANSFAGEKEKKTLEGLLYAPVTDFQLYLSKCLAAFIPAVSVAFIGFVVYAIIIDILTYPVFGFLILPNSHWIGLILWLVPTFSFFGLGVTVLVSAKVRGFQEAQQLAGVVVIPILAMIIMQLSGVIFLSGWVIFIIGFIFLLMDIFLLKIGANLFKGDKILDKFV
ncbi:hypothetical protein BBF96_01050 [Anoxybacter fermentans]|uniref:ABC transporter permease n=1 Tax=Anoxybacter fermentans TaxID=1323375 RepID=A0A3Q9HNR1_9FIRM|nr:ABC transporter permease [Anoxybacter fermentans]AZR72101.1 hypothetical protein BBF96_01050 [Anoxybacter fermentans]